jgi:hypothetical protein
MLKRTVNIILHTKSLIYHSCAKSSEIKGASLKCRTCIRICFHISPSFESLLHIAINVWVHDTRHAEKTEITENFHLHHMRRFMTMYLYYLCVHVTSSLCRRIFSYTDVYGSYNLETILCIYIYTK